MKQESRSLAKTYLFFLLLPFFITRVNAQWTESFSSSGDITTGLHWQGTSGWEVVRSSDVGAGAPCSYTLQLNAVGKGSGEYRSTRPVTSWGREQSWGFWIGRRGAPADAYDMSVVWLYADEPNPFSLTIDGYRVRYGDELPSGDRIVLEEVRDGAAAPIINSAYYVPEGMTDYGFLVRVTRSAAGQWTLYTSPLPQASGTGALPSDLPDAAHASVFQGSMINNRYTFFDRGYIIIEATHGLSAAARTGASFDQLYFSPGGTEPLPFAGKSSSIPATDRTPQFVLYPDPVSRQDVQLRANGLTAGTYKIEVYNGSSQYVFGKELHHSGGTLTTSIQTSGLRPGLYILLFSGAVRWRRQFVVQ